MSTAGAHPIDHIRTFVHSANGRDYVAVLISPETFNLLLEDCASAMRLFPCQWHREEQERAVYPNKSIGCAITDWPFGIRHRPEHFSRINRLVINFRTNNRDWLWPPTVGQ
jgi:hypothetical protein